MAPTVGLRTAESAPISTLARSEFRNQGTTSPAGSRRFRPAVVEVLLLGEGLGWLDPGDEPRPRALLSARRSGFRMSNEGGHDGANARTAAVQPRDVSVCYLSR